nr:hypothetical protein CFP56_60586 [Quercus suber]
MKLLVASSLQEEVLLLEKEYIPSECKHQCGGMNCFKEPSVTIGHFSVFHDSSRLCSSSQGEIPKGIVAVSGSELLVPEGCQTGKYCFCSGYCCDPMHMQDLVKFTVYVC